MIKYKNGRKQIENRKIINKKNNEYNDFKIFVFFYNLFISNSIKNYYNKLLHTFEYLLLLL